VAGKPAQPWLATIRSARSGAQKGSTSICSTSFALHAFKRRAGYRGSFEVLCGYRSAATNRKLCKKNRHAAKESRHVVGQAVDLRFHGLTIDEARKTVLAMKAGGVGYYPRENFIHLDVGPVRSWSN
jgi:uncharacterized protein YcbK (DUF882 family)